MNVQGIIRIILTLGGSFLIGHNLFGTSINESLWQEISGAVMILAGVVMSVLDKTLTIEKFQGSIRHVFLVVAGLLVAKGIIKPEQIEMYLGILAALGTIVYQILSKKKSQAIESGAIKVAELKK